jgi:hypothetical protein
MKSEELPDYKKLLASQERLWYMLLISCKILKFKS